jgi:hypothetical protein
VRRRVAARGDRAPRARKTEATSCTNSKASGKPLISMIRMQPTPLTQSRYKHLAREAVLKARDGPEVNLELCQPCTTNDVPERELSRTTPKVSIFEEFLHGPIKLQPFYQLSHYKNHTLVQPTVPTRSHVFN